MGSGKSKEKQVSNEPVRTSKVVQEKQNQEKNVTSSNVNNKNVSGIQTESRVNGHISDRKNNSYENTETNQVKKHGADSKRDTWNDDDLDLDNAWVSKNTTVIETKKKIERSDSELEEEFRLNEFNRKKTLEIERLEKAKMEQYPESYAQKNMRQQYTTELLRQKTIYRNPDEWNEDEDLGDGDSFDVSKFKKANIGTSQPKKDIFGNEDTDYTKRDMGNSYDYSYGQSNTHRKSVPKYDITEEELMADIEKDLI